MTRDDAVAEVHHTRYTSLRELTCALLDHRIIVCWIGDGRECHGRELLIEIQTNAPHKSHLCAPGIPL